MSDHKKVAIVIAIYNRSKDLKKLLQSIAGMDYDNYEVLVVDNGSSENLRSIVELYPAVQYFRCATNLGATGGYNTGIRHFLDREDIDYIWLLDSDLIVRRGTLHALIKVFHENPEAALVGPKILNKSDPTKIVEIGAKIHLHSGQVEPLFCNQEDTTTMDVFEVDYVGTGISLFDRKKLIKTGLYDDRYFFMWEDMDMGLAVQAAGFKVFATSEAAVLHEAFTEKRSIMTDAYYGIRAQMLTISKFLPPTEASKALFHICRRINKGTLFRLFNGQKYPAYLSLQALFDFIFNRWGKYRWQTRQVEQQLPKLAPQATGKKFVLLPSGNNQTLSEILDRIHQLSPDASVSLVIQEYRKELVNFKNISAIITYNDKATNLIKEHLRVFLTLLRTNRDEIVINPDPERGSPFTYAFKNVWNWSESDNTFTVSSENIFSAWKLLAALVCGELAALCLAPLLFFSSLRYWRNQSNSKGRDQ